eukprot:COSAG05_NODE_139_length_16772_cov_35.582559_9_plen_167_part_00
MHSSSNTGTYSRYYYYYYRYLGTAVVGSYTIHSKYGRILQFIAEEYSIPNRNLHCAEDPSTFLVVLSYRWETRRCRGLRPAGIVESAPGVPAHPEGPCHDCSAAVVDRKRSQVATQNAPEAVSGQPEAGAGGGGSTATTTAGVGGSRAVHRECLVGGNKGPVCVFA